MIFQLHEASCPQASLGRGNSGQDESLSDGPSGAQPLPESLYLPTKAASRVSLGLGQLLSSSFPRPPFSAQAHNPALHLGLSPRGALRSMFIQPRRRLRRWEMIYLECFRRALTAAICDFGCKRPKMIDFAPTQESSTRRL